MKNMHAPCLKAIAVCTLLFAFMANQGAVGKDKEKAYEPAWKSLIKHPVPEWFKDAKFGIYTHWGIYSVPAFDTEWYPRNMYIKGHRVFIHHRETYGPQEEFGYKDFIPQFTAEKFNADEWVDLFIRAGARFVGPVAEHHDGFAMWDSHLSDWTAAKMGPKRDVVGEMEKAVRKRGLKFVTSFHHAFNWKYYEPAFQYDARDPRYAGLYGDPHFPGTPESEEFLEDWLARLKEVIDRYMPDYMWFDFCWGQPTFESYKRKYLAYYYNKATESDRDVVVTYKGRDLPLGAGVLDLERGRLDSLRKDIWINDTSIDTKSWCYILDPGLKSVNTLIDGLIDGVSKNGNTLLNVAPRPDGTIPDEQREILLGIGKWLEVNGEAFYGTRPWRTYGEGPTKMAKAGGFSEEKEMVYTRQDIRFTTKGNVLYAIALDWPEEQLTVTSLKRLDASKIQSITLLGAKGNLEWTQTADGLKIKTPKIKPCDHAYAFKIAYQGRLPRYD